MSTIGLTYRKLIHLVRPSREREELHYLLSTATPGAPLAERVAWLEKLMTWVRTASGHAHDFNPATGQLHNVRLRFLLHLLDRNPDWKARVAATLRSLVAETSALSLFTQIGLGQQKGFLAEASDRLFRGLLPHHTHEGDLSEVFLRIFDHRRDAIWVSHIPPALMEQFVTLIEESGHGGPVVFKRWHEELEAALLILGARIGATGTLPEVRTRLKEVDIQESPFLNLSFHLTNLVRAVRGGAATETHFRRCLDESAACRAEIERVYVTLEHEGVSVALVYTLESLSDATRRADILIGLLMPGQENVSEIVIELLATLVRERLSQKNLRDLITANLRLMSRKIVERAGASGEHYITRTRAEYFEMLRAGIGGGVLMVFTTIVKFQLGAWTMPLFFEGLFFSLNYSVSFVLLQLMGFTLATKQPSATASALAGKLKDLNEDGEVREFVSETCRATRSQFAALVGNLLLLVPLSIFLDFACYAAFGSHILSAAKAHYVLHSLNPIASLSVPMAALTGVFLWMSSLAAGWLENWVVFHRIPGALAVNPRLIRVFGEKGAHKIGQWTLNNATLIGGNVSLGFFLGFTPIAGLFLGLPLDVRHVTLSSASLTLAACSLSTVDLHWQMMCLPVLGILFIGLLNFGVSYSLALAVAVRARDVKLGVVRRLLRAVRKRLRNHPREFFLPPAAE